MNRGFPRAGAASVVFHLGQNTEVKTEKMSLGRRRDVVAKPLVFLQNDCTALTKCAKIMKIFEGIDQSKSRDACFGTKK